MIYILYSWRLLLLKYASWKKWLYMYTFLLIFCIPGRGIRFKFNDLCYKTTWNIYLLSYRHQAFSWLCMELLFFQNYVCYKKRFGSTLKMWPLSSLLDYKISSNVCEHLILFYDVYSAYFSVKTAFMSCIFEWKCVTLLSLPILSNTNVLIEDIYW